MGINRPTVNGGTISVSDSAALAAMPINGLPIGSSVWNEDVGAFFTLTSSARTAITIASTDGYDSGVWTFANATFTGFEDCTLLISLIGADDVFGGAYNIDVVDSATEVEVTPAPDGATTAPILGSATLFSDKLVTDSVVAASGVIGLRWVVATALEAPVPNADLATMAAHTFKARKTNSTGVPEDASATEATALLDVATASLKGLMSAADKAGLPADVAGVLSGGNAISFGTLDGDNDGDYEIEFDLICLTNAPGQIYLKINGGTINQSSAFVYYFGSVGGTTLDPGLSVYSNGATARVTGFIRLTSKTGKWRSFSCTACDGTPNAVLQVGNYKDTSTNITGLSIVATNATSFDAGSTAKLRKLHKA